MFAHQRMLLHVMVLHFFGILWDFWDFLGSQNACFLYLLLRLWFFSWFFEIFWDTLKVLEMFWNALSFFCVLLRFKSHNEIFTHAMKVLRSDNLPIQGIERSQWIYIFIYYSIYLYITCIYIYILQYIYIYACTNKYMHIVAYIYIYAYIYIHMHIYIYTHIYIYHMILYIYNIIWYIYIWIHVYIHSAWYQAWKFNG